MEREYNYEEKITEKRCKCCGYVYAIQTKDYDNVIKGDADFIELGQTDVVKQYYIEKTTLYACPKCGCVHIEV